MELFICHYFRNLFNFAFENLSFLAKMVSKTRDKLIEVARQLFLKKGVENTTMNDIAAASDKGRRTIYTYFKNKKEIYNAVFEQQSDRLLENIRPIIESSLSPAEKLRRYLNARLCLVQNITTRNDRTHMLFNREHRRLEKVMRMVQMKDRSMLGSILNEGVEAGVFDSSEVENFLSTAIAVAIGVDVTSGRNLGNSSSAMIDIEGIISYLLSGIEKNLNNEFNHETT